MSYKIGDNRIYVGNLPPDVRTKDLEDLFEKYGKINYVDLKNRKGPPFAFIEFDDARDAEDAVDARDGYSFDGYKLRVEFQKGSKNGTDSDKSQLSKGGGGGSRSGPPNRRSEYRCIVTGLPPTGSWQDLKDHMREAGNVCYADVFKDGTGVVEFLRYDDMKYAARNLDDSKFRSHEGETTYIRVRMDPKYSRSESRSSRSRSRSSRRGERATPSYSPMRRTSESRSRSRSSRRSRSNSRTRRRSRSHRTRSRSPYSHSGRSKRRSRSRSTSRVKKMRGSRSKSRSQSK